MAKKSVEKLLIDGGADKVLQGRYDEIAGKEEFVAAAVAEGYDFTIDELDAVLAESGDSFERNGNPPKRQIWWR